ncbi:hypothetical protein EIP91_005968 [Steccherinum ochraceum]|uniref:Uncharacterized protein n=1 Tax=Steccherinum ochraceum TaxID=92696 RepID=A0A4R0R6F7_9APHY|nr:hypothetical protein EIP91_005968 [Steccherinum ochraceum]
MWQSREVAGKIQGTIEEFLSFQLDSLLDVEVSLEAKTDTVVQMMEVIEARQISAKEISINMKGLHDQVHRDLNECDHYLQKKCIVSPIDVRKMFTELYESLVASPPPPDTFTQIMYAMAGYQSNATLSVKGLTIVSKIGALCNIWAAIRSALQGIHESLRFQKESSVVSQTSRRVEALRGKLFDLQPVLTQYQNSVV